MCERDELAEPLVVGEVEAGHPPDGVEREVAGALEAGCEAGQLPLGRHPVEATDAHVDGMDGPTTDQLDQLVADLLQLEATLHHVPMVGGEVDDPVVAEEVGRVEEVDVERVALDPLPAVEEAAQVGEGTVDRDAAQRLDGVAGAHLVRHRADAADPGGDVRRLGVGPPPQHRLEEARRLVDPQLDGAQDPVTDDDVHGPLALDAGQRVDPERPLPVGRRHGEPPCSRRRALVAERRRVHVERAQHAHQVDPLDPEPVELRGQRGRVRILGRAEAAVAAPVVGGAEGAAAGMRDGSEAGRAVGDHHAHVAAQLALDAHAVAGHVGAPLAEEGGDDVEQLSPIDGAAAQLEVDGDVGADRCRGGQRRDVARRGVHRVHVLVDVGVVAQRLDPAGRRAGADRHESARGRRGSPGCARRRGPS